MDMNKMLLSAVVIALSLPMTATAQEWYGTAMLGYSQQASDSEAYGNNIAVDPSFPDTFDGGDGGLAVLGVGYTFNEQLRVEGRLGFHRGEFNDKQLGLADRAGAEFILDGEIESTTLTVEGFYAIPVNSMFSPYLKAGVGVARNSYSARLGGAGVADFDPFDGNVDGYYDNYADQTSTEFTWNVGFGGSVSLSDKARFFAEYQYVSLGDVETGQDDFTDGFKIDGAAAHEVLLGIRGRF